MTDQKNAFQNHFLDFFLTTYRKSDRKDDLYFSLRKIFNQDDLRYITDTSFHITTNPREINLSSELLSDKATQSQAEIYDLDADLFKSPPPMLDYYEYSTNQASAFDLDNIQEENVSISGNDLIESIEKMTADDVLSMFNI